MPSKEDKKTADKYEKKTQLEHILDRPAMYIGSTESVEEEIYIFDNELNKIIKKRILINHGLQRIFEEILLNSFDQTVRDGTGTKNIKVNIDKTNNSITIQNDGHGIPIIMKDEYKLYIPEMIFGHLFTSSNYNKEEKKIVGGQNGLGAKLTNIFSKSFILETIDDERKKSFKLSWKDNFQKDGEAEIKSCRKKGSTSITFIPDLERFGMSALSDDMINLFKKRIYDIACNTHSNITVYYNDEKIPIKKFEDYIKLYILDDCEKKIIVDEDTNQRWSVGLILNEEFSAVSFVNGINTNMNGSHVDHVSRIIINQFMEKLSKKKVEVKPGYIKDKMFIFVKCFIENPEFNSQTKEILKTKPSSFGSSFKISDKFIKGMMKTGIFEEVMEFSQFKEKQSLNKNNGSKKKRVKIAKLYDANFAGTNKSDKCKLFLTEGDSALSYAIKGLNKIGQDYYGCFPLKGKCISEETQVPLWNGDIKFAKDIQKGDIIIGDDGNQRKVLTLFKGHGEMYEVKQDMGEPYQVNDNHILTLCMPEHKSIFWSNSSHSWNAKYWDTESRCIKYKKILTSVKINCNDCNESIGISSLKRHYQRKHNDLQLTKQNYNIDMKNEEIIQSYNNLQEFLSNIDDNNIIDINIQDYLNLPKSHQRKLKGIRSPCINWNKQSVILDPYVLGIWLSDGSKSGYSFACRGVLDYQIIDYLKNWGLENDANLTQSSSNKYCYNFSSITNFRKMNESLLKKLLKKYNLINNKHIPKEYLINSKDIRLKLLAGIIDTDGYVCKDGTIEISQSTIHKKLVDDIVYLSRSLGFYTYVKIKTTNYKYKLGGNNAKAYIIKISGNTCEIPILLSRKKSKSTTMYNLRNSTGIINIKKINDCNYVGIGIDGNNRFLINDFTITHNCMNVRDALPAKINGNDEITRLKEIIGLKHGHKYTSLTELRYGGIICLTDQDLDGYHIRGLIINMVHAFWPELIDLGFVCSFATPIVKATKNNEKLEFFTLTEFENWENNNNTKGWNIKYYKGLGTSQKQDVQESFDNFSQKIIMYHSDENTNKDINLGFNKKLADNRKEWLLNYDKQDIIHQTEKKIPIGDIIHKELKHFSYYDIYRSIPSLIDGLKPTQRKILYTGFKFIPNSTREVKVAQFGAKVAEKTSYHHGEKSVFDTIINMGQTYIGSNNMNLLLPLGEFGTRLMGGSDHASERYIFTNLSPVTHKLFNKADENILNYLVEEHQQIEPEWYVPCLPNILINGAIGIGTGFSTTILQHSVDDIANYYLSILNEKKRLPKVNPNYRFFKGQIESEKGKENKNKNKYKVYGNYELNDSDCSMVITELPIGTWTTNYKEFIESLLLDKSADKKKLKDQCIIDYQIKPSDVIIYFKLYFEKSYYQELKKKSQEWIYKKFKLVSNLSENNMYLFDENGNIKKYKDIYEILNYFYTFRLKWYQKRKDYILEKLELEMNILKNKVKFIKYVNENKLKIIKITDIKLIQQLDEYKFDKFKNTSDEFNYDYLINMKIRTLTTENAKKLTDEFKIKQEECLIMKNTDIKDLWKKDINDLLVEYNKYNKYLQTINNEDTKKKKK